MAGRKKKSRDRDVIIRGRIGGDTEEVPVRKATGRRRTTIGEDPLDSVVPTPAEKDPRVQAATKASRKGLAPRGTTPRPEPSKKEPKKARATFHLPKELMEECRAAVVHLAGPPVRLTLAAMAEDALRKELERLKKKHNEGEPFPSSDVKLRGGRPIGS